MDTAFWNSGCKSVYEIEGKIADAHPGTVHGLPLKVVVADDGDFWGEPSRKLLVENALAILEDLSA